MTDEPRSSSTGESSLDERLESLESIIESQQETIEKFEKETDERTNRDDSSGFSPVSRRSALAGIAGLAGLGAMSSSASAATPQGQVGTADRPLNALYAQQLQGVPDGETPFDVLVGSERALRFTAGDGGDAGNVIAGHSTNSVDGDGFGATIGGGGESLAPNTVSGSYSTIGGGLGNETGDEQATVGGGSDNVASGGSSTVGGGEHNEASGNRSTVAGGDVNEASGSRSTVGGGFQNTADGTRSTVSGGDQNQAGGTNAFVGGGEKNEASAWNATVGGGYENTASGQHSTVLGGRNNTADGTYSVVAGRNANASRPGQFVFTDSHTETENHSTGIANRFYCMFQNGYYFRTDSVEGNAGVWMGNGDTSWSAISSAESKTNITPVDAKAVLEKVANLELSTWSYNWQTDTRHMGPMAGEFFEAFGLGGSDEGIQTIDADGVLFAAVQGLAAELADRDERIDDLESRVEELERDEAVATPEVTADD